VYDLVIFDLDGTLIDSVGDIADALNVTLGTAHPDAVVAAWVGSGVRVLLERAGVAHAELDEAVVRFRAAYAAQPCKHTRPYLRVRETLRALDCDKAVATNKPGELSRAILGKLGLADEFVAVLGEDDVGARKPDPLIVDILRGKVGALRARDPGCTSMHRFRPAQPSANLPRTATSAPSPRPRRACAGAR